MNKTITVILACLHNITFVNANNSTYAGAWLSGDSMGTMPQNVTTDLPVDPLLDLRVLLRDYNWTQSFILILIYHL